MDEASRMARAADQGYSIDAYKGMYPYDWRTVPTRNWKDEVISGHDLVPKEISSIDSGNIVPTKHADDLRAIKSNYAGFFSNSPDVASRFATNMNGSVYPVKLKFENPKVIDAQGRYAADFQFGPGAGRLLLDKDSPHDGVILKNTKDEGDVYIPRHPSQVRSKFAAFDPENKDSGYLLASGIGSLLGATAVAGQNDMKYASGGNVLPFYARSEARNLEHSGFIHSPVPGRTDRLPMGVKGGSYVLPADTVSAVGQGNSLAGAHALTRLFGMGPYGSSMPHISGGRPSIPKLPSVKPPKFARGGPVDIVAAGGEMVIPPHVVAQIGKGDMKLGHDILDAFVKHTRAKTVKKLKSLPDPKKK